MLGGHSSAPGPARGPVTAPLSCGDLRAIRTPWPACLHGTPASPVAGAIWAYSWCMRSNWADWGARELLGDLSGLRKPLAGHYLSSFNGGRAKEQAVAGGARGKNGASVPRRANGEGGGPGRVPAISAPAFTGRQHELAALGRTLAGPPAVVLVEGEAGIGKSRLVREFLDRANGQVRRG